MSTPAKNLRLSDEANAALKRVVARFPEWSEARMASKLLVEACQAALGEKPATLPTVAYLRGQIDGVTEPQPRLNLSLHEILDLLHDQQSRTTDDPPEYRAKASARRASGE